jgi:excisionase family DNA binding protein
MTTPRIREAERAYNITEAAELKGVSPDTIRRAIRSGTLAAKHVGRGYRIAASSLEAWWDALPDG